MGVEPEDALPFLHEVERLSENVELVGLSTHFATSDELDRKFMNKQLTKFEKVIREVKHAGITVPLVHCANSGAIIQCPRETTFDMVRPGIMMYGYAPSWELQEQYGDQLQPPLSLSSAIVYKKRVAKGEGVSYNCRWICPKDTTIATVPIGYGDGYPRLLTNRASALIRGKLYPVVGTICMDQVLIDLGEDDIHVSERVDFICASSRELNAWTLAQTIGTIPYEILTSVAARVPRVEV